MIKRGDVRRLWAKPLSHRSEALILFLLAILCLTPVGLTGMDLFDEGIRLHGAERVLNGDFPYHDFYAIYGPAQFYWPALLFKIFGINVITFRASIIVFTALMAVAVFTLCRMSGVGTGGSFFAFLLIVLPRNGSASDLVSCDPAVAVLLSTGVILMSKPSRLKRMIADARQSIGKR